MSKVGVFRSQTQQMPMTARPLSATPIIRRMSTATKKIQESGTNVIDISGYTTVHGYAAQGRTPSPGAGSASHHNSAGNTRVPALQRKFSGRLSSSKGH